MKEEIYTHKSYRRRYHPCPSSPEEGSYNYHAAAYYRGVAPRLLKRVGELGVGVTFVRDARATSLLGLRAGGGVGATLARERALTRGTADSRHLGVTLTRARTHLLAALLTAATWVSLSRARVRARPLPRRKDFTDTTDTQLFWTKRVK